MRTLRAAILFGCGLLAASPFASAAEEPQAAAPANELKFARPIEAQPGGLQAAFTRWIDVKTAVISSEYRSIENGMDVKTHSQALQKDNYHARVKLTANGDYSVVTASATGTSFTASWNTTGIGTGDAVTNRYMKQLFFSAKPVKGLELQYGGLGLVRGKSSEITSYDNDGYVEGGRIIVKRPDQLGLDEVAVTYAYIGDTTQPNVFRRLHRLGGSNYHQFLAVKKLSNQVSVSGDYTFAAGTETLRQAVQVNLPAGSAIDGARFEVYERLDVRKAEGFAASVEKKYLKRLNVTAGYASIDPNYGSLNSNRFYSGNKVYGMAEFAVTPEVSAQFFIAQAVNNAQPPKYGRYTVYMVNYDLLGRIKKACTKDKR